MANNNLTGRARVSTRHPEAFGVCDTCGFVYNRVQLVEQMEYQGNDVRPTGFLVCTSTCNDMPQPQFSTPILPNDPYPILNPRPDLYPGAMSQPAPNPPGDAFEMASSVDPASTATPVSGLP